MKRGGGVSVCVFLGFIPEPVYELLSHLRIIHLGITL